MKVEEGYLNDSKIKILDYHNDNNKYFRWLYVMLFY